MKAIAIFAGLLFATGAAQAAEPVDLRWSLLTEKDGIGKIASIKGADPKNFIIIRCNKASKATMLFSGLGIKPTQSLQLRLTGAPGGQHVDLRLAYLNDAKVWSMATSDEAIALLSGKDTRLIAKPVGSEAIEFSLAGSTKAISDAMLKCSPATRPATEEDVRSVVNAGYQFYYRQLGEVPDDPHAFKYSSALEAAFANAQKHTEIFPEADPFCKCQDFDERKFRHQIANIVMNGNKATVRVYVAPFGGPLVGDPVAIELMRLPTGKWAVDDVDGLKAEALGYDG